MKRWLRRLLLLALVGGVVTAVLQRRQPQRPPLTVVPPPRPVPPTKPVPPASPAVVADPDPEPAAEPEPVDVTDDEDDGSGSDGFGGFSAFSSPGEPVPGDHPGSVRALASGAAPGPQYTIKGNADSMIFHTPDSPSYHRTVAEVWFASEDDAVAAGFRAPKRRGRS